MKTMQTITAPVGRSFAAQECPHRFVKCSGLDIPAFISWWSFHRREGLSIDKEKYPACRHGLPGPIASEYRTKHEEAEQKHSPAGTGGNKTSCFCVESHDRGDAAEQHVPLRICRIVKHKGIHFVIENFFRRRRINNRPINCRLTFLFFFWSLGAGRLETE